MSFFYMLKKMWLHSENRKFLIVLFYILHIISMLGLLGQPYVFAQIFNVLQNNADNLVSDINFWIGIYVVLFFVFNIFHRLGRHIEQRVAFKNRQAFINDLYNKLLRLPMKWHSDNHSGSTINKIKISSEALHNFSELQFKYIEHIMMFCGPLVILTILSYQISIIAFILAIFTVMLISKFDIKIVPLFKAENETVHKFFATIFDYVSNIRTIITLRINNQTREELNNKIELAYPILTESIKINQYKWASISFCILLLEVGIVFYYINIKISSNEVIMLGTIVAIFQYLQQLGKMFFNITNDYQDIIRMKTDYVSSDDILEIEDFVNEDLFGNTNWKQIDVKNLNFLHDTSTIHGSIRNINISLKSNSKIAVVGPSGAGKSTLLLLLRGLYNPDSCNTYIDGKLNNLSSLSSLTTLIPQDPEIFENTIQYNICFGVEKLEVDLLESIEIARLNQLLDKLANGLNTDIREKGVNLSGGEKQRLALARGIVAAKDSSILLLDEPTSSVDAYNEGLIYNKLFEKFNNRCIISSIHRLHLLYMFDYIYVMSEGNLVQEGNLDKLLEDSDGIFIKLWEKYKKTSSS